MMALFTFVSVHHALKAEKMLKEASIWLDMIPTPRSISTSCGMCIVVKGSQANSVEELFDHAGVQIKSRYHQGAFSDEEWIRSEAH